MRIKKLRALKNVFTSSYFPVFEEHNSHIHFDVERIITDKKETATVYKKIDKYLMREVSK